MIAATCITPPRAISRINNNNILNLMFELRHAQFFNSPFIGDRFQKRISHNRKCTWVSDCLMPTLERSRIFAEDQTLTHIQKVDRVTVDNLELFMFDFLIEEVIFLLGKQGQQIFHDYINFLLKTSELAYKSLVQIDFLLRHFMRYRTFKNLIQVIKGMNFSQHLM